MQNSEVNALVIDIKKELLETGNFNKIKMEQLWKIFMPIVNKMAYYKSIKTGGQQREDLIQVCYLALCSAVDKYNQDKIDFRRYAMYWFMAFIRLENIRNISPFKYSSRQDRKLFNKISKVSELSLNEQASILGVTVEDLGAFLLSVEKICPVQKKKANSSSNDEEEEYIPSNYPQPDFLYEAKTIYETSKEVFDSFTESLTSDREREVLNLLRRVGNPDKGNFTKKEEDAEPTSYQDLADKYEISRERIRQIASSIKDKLRFRLIKNGITANDFGIFS